MFVFCGFCFCYVGIANVKCLIIVTTLWCNVMVVRTGNVSTLVLWVLFSPIGILVLKLVFSVGLYSVVPY